MRISDDTQVLRNFFYDRMFLEEDAKKLRPRNMERDNIIVVEDVFYNDLVYIWSYSSKCNKLYVSRINKQKNVIIIANEILSSLYNQI